MCVRVCVWGGGGGGECVVCMCVQACVRARVRVCVRVCVRGGGGGGAVCVCVLLLNDLCCSLVVVGNSTTCLCATKSPRSDTARQATVDKHLLPCGRNGRA